MRNAVKWKDIAMVRINVRLTLVLLGVSLLFPTGGYGRVVRIEIDTRTALPRGLVSGKYGTYELLTGRIYFAFDPDIEYNSRIVDLDKAPTNAEGDVEAWANFMVLQPKNPSVRRGLGLVEVSNRGGKAALRYFNNTKVSTRLPEDIEHFGDGLLMRLGLTIIWVGWQFDVPEREGQLRLHVPTATDADKAIEGWVRADWTVDQTAPSLPLGHRNHRVYPITHRDDSRNVLTVREGRLAPRQVIPGDRWHSGRVNERGVLVFCPINSLTFSRGQPRTTGPAVYGRE